MAQKIAKKKSWREMRDEEIAKKMMWWGVREKLRNRSERYFIAGLIILYLGMVLGSFGIILAAVSEYLKLLGFITLIMGVICVVVLGPTCLIVWLRLDKKLHII